MLLNWFRDLRVVDISNKQAHRVHRLRRKAALTYDHKRHFVSHQENQNHSNLPYLECLPYGLPGIHVNICSIRRKEVLQKPFPSFVMVMMIDVVNIHVNPSFLSKLGTSRSHSGSHVFPSRFFEDQIFFPLPLLISWLFPSLSWVCVCVLPVSFSPVPVVWPHWRPAAPSSSAPAPPAQPAASVGSPASSAEPRGAALADHRAADSSMSEWLNHDQ